MVNFLFNLLSDFFSIKLNKFLFLIAGQCFAQGNSYYCQCPLPFTGQRCEVRPDPCSPNPCMNGQCVAQGTSYNCICPPGYSGQRCENANPCMPNPCNY
jgi:Notch-like protein